MTWNASHRGEHGRIRDTPPFDLVLNHSGSKRLEILVLVLRF